MTGEKFWTPDRFRAVTQGRWIHRPVNGGDAAERPGVINGVSTDTRTIQPHQAFVAIRGDRHDAHSHLDEAVRAGASLLVVEQTAQVAPSDRDWPEDLFVLEVSATRRALAQLGAAYRKTLKTTRVIGVTGSAGKTTTKRLIDTVLRGSLRGSASPKSYNNDIGVPLTILGAHPGDKYLVVEIGTNAPGEIASLAAITEPDIAVITSIGRSHLERLGSVDGVAREKAAILASLRPEGWAIVNADAPVLRSLVPTGPHVVTFGHAEDADLRITDVRAESDGVRFTLNRHREWRVPLHGLCQALNATAAIAVARRMGLSDEQIQAGFDCVMPEAMRFNLIAGRDGLVIYNDAYNANPDSMRSAIETFAALSRDAPRRLLVLGDMLELGGHSGEAHRELARQIMDVDQQARIDRVTLIGVEIKAAAETLRRAWDPDRVSSKASIDDLEIHDLIESVSPGVHVLVKGSRSMGLERVVEAFENAANRSPPAEAG